MKKTIRRLAAALCAVVMLASVFVLIPSAHTRAAAAYLPNGDYYFVGVNTGKVVCGENYGNDIMIANRDSYGGDWEKITIVNNSDGTVSFRSGANNKYVCMVDDENKQLLARSASIQAWEKFYIESVGGSQFAIKSAQNGKYVTVNQNDSNRLYATASAIQAWEWFYIYSTSGAQQGTTTTTTTTTTTKAPATTTTRAQQSSAALGAGDYYFKGVNTGKVVCGENYGNDIMIANRDSYGGDWEKITVIVNSDGSYSFRSGANNKYVCMVDDENKQLLARSSAIDAWEKFSIESVGGGQFAIKSRQNGKYVTVNENDSNRLYATASAVQAWECFYIFTTSGQQVTSGGSSSTQPTSGGGSSSNGKFRVVAYCPNWYGDITGSVDWSKITHTNYSFAIPTSSGGIMSLNDNGFASRLVSVAHQNGVQVGLAVGGWSYNGATLQSTFEQATSSASRRTTLVNSIMSVVDQYGFDGVDVDWEYPTSSTASQYESFMTELNSALDNRGKWLSIAVMGGVDTNGNALSSAYSYSNNVLNMVDWVNVMAYDGNEGSGHSPYSYAVNCGNFWINTRGVNKSKVNVGVPFYERPNWASYADIIRANANNAYSDSAWINGTQVWYNGLNTMANKTVWACQNAGGIMIWEISQDTSNQSLSLLKCISDNIKTFYPNYK